MLYPNGSLGLTSMSKSDRTDEQWLLPTTGKMLVEGSVRKSRGDPLRDLNTVNSLATIRALGFIISPK